LSPSPGTVARLKGKSLTFRLLLNPAAPFAVLESGKRRYALLEHWREAPDLPGHILVTTDRNIPDIVVGQGEVLYLREGMRGELEEDRSALSGRHPITKALSLAVHLGASRVMVHGSDILTSRAVRECEAFSRPLKRRKVRVYDATGDGATCSHIWPNV